MSGPAINWRAVDQDPRFRALHRKKSAFLWGLMAFSAISYFLLPFGAAYFSEGFGVRVWGPVNLGLVLALGEFLIAWGVALLYYRHANREFDALAEELVRDAPGMTERR